MKILHLEDSDICYKLVESKFMNLTVLSIQSSNNHSITIKITLTGILDSLEEIIKQSSCSKGFTYFILNLITNVNEMYNNEVLSIMVDSEFLHIGQLSSNLMCSSQSI